MPKGRRRTKPPSSLLDTLCILVAAATVCISRAEAASPQLQYPTPDAADAGALALPSPLGSLVYTPGRGLRVGDTHLTIGGYANVNLTRDEGGPGQLSWDDLSFFVIADPTPRIHFFSEIELEDLVEVNNHGHGGTVNHIYTTERLYSDVTVSDQVNLRVGKFLTPVGRWNVIHAQPLVWTTSRPLATLLPFDPHVTGAMVFGSFFPTAGSLNYALYGQFVNQFNPVAQPQPADRSAGARLEYTRNGLSIGSSYFAFTHRGDWQHLIGLDTLWQRGPLELMGEFVFEEALRDPGTQWGLYLQSVFELVSQFYLVGRYEHFDQRLPQPEVNLVDLGVAYKPVPPIVLKAEYLIADHPAQESAPGFKCSFAILF